MAARVGLTWRESRALGAEPTAPPPTSACSQDVDAAFMGRMDLHGKVDGLTDEINFLRHLYEEVR